MSQFLILFIYLLRKQLITGSEAGVCLDAAFGKMIRPGKSSSTSLLTHVLRKTSSLLTMLVFAFHFGRNLLQINARDMESGLWTATKVQGVTARTASLILLKRSRKLINQQDTKRCQHRQRTEMLQLGFGAKLLEAHWKLQLGSPTI